MRAELDSRLNSCRVRVGQWGSDPQDGANGAFAITGPSGAVLRIIASDGVDPIAQEWEHVSVSVASMKRTPNWAEMTFVKGLFWDDEETVIQFHPKRSEYVNYHPTTLHMWRHRTTPIETPPAILVGPK